jgi:nucleoside-diphosphate-sugar epimerase
MAQQVLIVGCGGLGTLLAQRLRGQGAEVTALVRSEQSAMRLRNLGFAVLEADLDRPMGDGLPGVFEQVCYLCPPPASGAQDPRVDNLLRALSPDGLPRRLVYLGTSGVYGDCQGAWIDETRPPRPQVDRARRRLDAERRVTEFCRRTGVEHVILRVAGIYGPGRLPLQRIRQGAPIVAAEQSPYTNRIHEQDLLEICLAAMRQPVAGEVFNVSDGRPGTMAEYFDAVADYAGLPRPPKISLAEAEALLSPGMLSYMRESRRLDNRKLQRLGVVLRYPDLQTGLAAMKD